MIFACWYNHGYNLCYTFFVKTAISLPEDLYRMAEAAARKLKISRSQLYATAIAEFLERRQTSKITERLNRIYAKERSELDPALLSAQLRSLEKDDW
jgi:metal-responsive CopG/Arc/MetJ family transcriptional regulator